MKFRFSSAFVCLFVSRVTKRTNPPTFTNISGKVAHGPWSTGEKRLYFGGNPDRVMLGLG